MRVERVFHKNASACLLLTTIIKKSIIVSIVWISEGWKVSKAPGVDNEEQETKNLRRKERIFPGKRSVHNLLTDCWQVYVERKCTAIKVPVLSTGYAFHSALVSL